MADEPTLTPRRQEVTIDQIRQHAGPAALDRDREEATDIGMPAPIVSGTMSQAIISDWLVSQFGESWVENGRLTVTFVDIVMPGDTLVVDGSATERDGRIEVDIECRVADGDETVIVGSATVEPA